jgi:predicted NUDIX family NTP pyrophosphohydrolase
VSPAISAGILLYRRVSVDIEVLVGHPGGPFWANKHEGVWSIPKGLVEEGEDARSTALREFAEETGHTLSGDGLTDLGENTLRSGKRVLVWAASGDLEPTEAVSNSVRLEWPRGSGRVIEFSELDELRWCSIVEAESLLNPAQRVFLNRLVKSLDHTE